MNVEVCIVNCLNWDIKEIRKDKNVFIKADKTANHYKTEPEGYMRLLNKNVTKAYKKINRKVSNAIATKDKQIAEKLDDWLS